MENCLLRFFKYIFLACLILLLYSIFYYIYHYLLCWYHTLYLSFRFAMSDSEVQVLVTSEQSKVQQSSTSNAQQVLPKAIKMQWNTKFRKTPLPILWTRTFMWSLSMGDEPGSVNAWSVVRNLSARILVQPPYNSYTGNQNYWMNCWNFRKLLNCRNFIL